MTSDIKYANSLAEVLYYLQGIKQEDVQKIPLTFMKYMAENATKNYNCTFDYNKPLNELNISEEAKGIIGLIAINYWCTNLEQKENLINTLNENEKKKLEKYNIQKIFEKRRRLLQKDNDHNMMYETYINVNKENKNANKSLSLTVFKQSFISKIFDRIKQIFKR